MPTARQARRIWEIRSSFTFARIAIHHRRLRSLRLTSKLPILTPNYCDCIRLIWLTAICRRRYALSLSLSLCAPFFHRMLYRLLRLDRRCYIVVHRRTAFPVTYTANLLQFSTRAVYLLRQFISLSIASRLPIWPRQSKWYMENLHWRCTWRCTWFCSTEPVEDLHCRFSM